VSQYSEIMNELATIREQNKWLVSAVKQLLDRGSGIRADEWESLVTPDDLDLDEGDDFDAEYAAAAAAVIPGTSGCAHILTAIRGGHVVCTQCGDDLGCAHNQQAVVNGRIVCAGCGTVLGQSGVVGRDPNAPQPGQETREPSSKNPGSPLVPY
jgi:hypothetical protein